MNQQVKRLSDEARSLAAAELAELVDDLLVALHQADPAVEKAWSEDCERRLDDFLRDKSAARAADVVIAKYLKP